MAKNHASDTDYKRNQKGYNMHQEHWEVKYHETVPNTEKNQVMGSCFNATNTKNRMKTYVPVNETDT